METQQLVDLGKQMNLAGEELHEFVRAEQALARDERIRIREENKEDEARIAEEAERIRKHEEEMFHLRIEAAIIRRRWVLQEKVWKDAEERQREKEDEDECSIPVIDGGLWRKYFREEEALARDEAEEIRQHEEYMLQRAYERLQWEKEDVARNAAKEEKERLRQQKKGEEREKAIPYIEYSKCVVTPINSARRDDFKIKANTCKEREGSTQVGPSTNEISGKEEGGRELPIGEVKVMQHEDVVKTAEMQHEKVGKIAERVIQHEEVEKNAEEEMQHVNVMKTAEEEMQHVKVTKTAEDEMQLEGVTPDSEASYYEVTQSKSEGDGVNVELITCADIAESAQVGYAIMDG